MKFSIIPNVKCFTIICALIIFFCVLKQLKGCPVYLTISLKEKQWLQINWGGTGCNHNNIPKLIGLYRKDPSIGSATNNKYDILISTDNNSSGQYISDIQFDNVKFPGGWYKWNYDNPITIYPKGKCLNYYLGSYYSKIENQNQQKHFKQKKLNHEYEMSVNCIKIQPNWMALNDDHISKLPLKDLFIPGTHSSGAYPPGSQSSRSILVKKFGYAQNFDVWSQLVFGIRFLDFKIGYRKSTTNTLKQNGINNTTTTTSPINNNNSNNFWIVNENMLINPLKPILNDIKEFLLKSGEVVIIDFSEFPIGFSNEPQRHSEFLEYLRNEIESFAFERSLAPPHCQSYELTVDDIRGNGKNLIILYPIEELTSADVIEYDFIWPSWKRFTVGNLNSDETLDFMRLLFSKKQSSPIQDEGWIFHGIKSLEESYSPDRNLLTAKERAKTVNPKINSWLTGPWSLTANVIVVDFFMSTNLIDMAIQVNAHKAFTTVNKNLTKIEII